MLNIIKHQNFVKGKLFPKYMYILRSNTNFLKFCQIGWELLLLLLSFNTLDKKCIQYLKVRYHYKKLVIINYYY